eukprot:30226_1
MAQVKPSDSANTGIDATVDPSSPIPVRESQVENGVRFLLHPSVASSPLNERTAFLVKKGLSKEEIDMAVTRALELRVEHEEDTEEVEPFWRRVLLPAVTVVGGAVALAKAMPPLKTVSAEQLNQRSSSVQDEEEPAMSSSTTIMRLANDICRLSTAIESQSSQLGEVAVNVRTVTSSLEGENLAELRNVLKCEAKELKTDLAAIQQLLTEKPVTSSHDHVHCVQDTNTSVLSIDEDPFLRRGAEQQEQAIGESNEDSLDKCFNDRLLAMRDAISLLASKNSSSTLHKAIPMLKLLISNLVKHPGVPRYWRISTTNQNFTDLVSPLTGHIEFLSGVGFTQISGSQLEWQWSKTKEDGDSTMNNKLLQEALTSLEELNDVDSSQQSIAVGNNMAETPNVATITCGVEAEKDC